MKIIALNSEIEQNFEDYIGSRIEEYFFFIFDQKFFPDKTRFLIALEEKIKGVALIYDERIVQLRGSDEAVKFLLEHLDLVPKEIVGIEKHQEILKARFPKAKLGFELMRMVIHPGEEQTRDLATAPISIGEIVELSSKDGKEIAELMRTADPIYWGDYSVDKLNFGKGQEWIGVKTHGKIIAITNIWVDETAGIVSIVGTHPDYQNRGLASGLVSRAVQRVFQKSKLGFIHVRADNTPAVHTYTKAGFKPFFKYQVRKLE
ncbi:MAG: GNAT family N-acetyltransferase [Promethearchaeota archaeon]